MSLRFHEISEANHRILNPLTTEKLEALGQACRFRQGMTHLDLCCGKGEMLLQWALKWGTRGTGVDISKVFLASAEARKAELRVKDVEFVEADASTYQSPSRYDIVSCIGATWIGDGLTGTIKLITPYLQPNGFMLIGEPFWRHPVPSDDQGFTTLAGTLDRIEACDMELVEMVLADEGSWDRYVCAQWLTADDWLRENPSSPIADEFREWIAEGKRQYLKFERDNMGWGVFVMRPKQAP
ncbi:MAG: class I SAM-dependent methyltransferase [bacterium]